MIITWAPPPRLSWPSYQHHQCEDNNTNNRLKRVQSTTYYIVTEWHTFFFKTISAFIWGDLICLTCEHFQYCVRLSCQHLHILSTSSYFINIIILYQHHHLVSTLSPYEDHHNNIAFSSSSGWRYRDSSGGTRVTSGARPHETVECQTEQALQYPVWYTPIASPVAI